MLLNQGGNGDAAYPLEMSLRFLPSTPLLEMSLRFLPRNGDAAYPLNSSAFLRHCVKLLFHSCGFAWIGGWLDPS